MSENYSKELCEEKHKFIEDTLELHNKRLNEHSKKIDTLEQDSREYKTEIKNLIKKMDDFMVTIRWGLGIFVTVSIFVIGILLKR
ncbi:hemolysin XhlA family protein [Candidatus Clostridium stratigraminis]|uniref:Hemolysin XhlA family protein n=1 Tax=Candidatus Clostridium stratigraminis TaxID=3381661 RepID=A0ABW8SZT3_9CLOT